MTAAEREHLRHKVFITGQPNVLDEELFLRYVKEVLDSRIFTNNGPLVLSLEKTICELVGVRHCMAVSSATTGIELLLAALELRGEEIIVPSFTFRATAQAVVRAGFRPVFCDVDEHRGLLLKSHLKSLTSKKTAAIMPVHLFGNIVDAELLEKSYQGIPIVLDAAQALLSSYKGKSAGSFAMAEVFSLHATKYINGFEGGLITTNDDELAARLLRLRNFDFPRELEINSNSTNAKLSEIHAAMALSNLSKAQVILDKNRRNFQAYTKFMPKQIKLVTPPEHVDNNHQYVIALVPAPIRDRLINVLENTGLFTRKYFSPALHKQFGPPYNQCHLAGADEIAGQTISLPTGVDLNEEDIMEICSRLEQAFLSLNG